MIPSPSSIRSKNLLFSTMAVLEILPTYKFETKIIQPHGLRANNCLRVFLFLWEELFILSAPGEKGGSIRYSMQSIRALVLGIE